MAYGKRVITSYRILPAKWRIVKPEGSELPPTQRYMRDLDRRLDELQPQRDAAHYAIYDLPSLVFANQTAEHRITSHQLATLIVERYRLAEKHMRDIQWRLDELLERRPIRVRYAVNSMQTERRERELERQILDLEKQKRDVQLKLWRDIIELRQDLSKERQEYRATRARVSYLSGGYDAGP